MITNSYQTSYTSLTNCKDHVHMVKFPKWRGVTQLQLCHLEGFWKNFAPIHFYRGQGSSLWAQMSKNMNCATQSRLCQITGFDEFFALDMSYTSCYVFMWNPQANGINFDEELSNLRIFTYFPIFTLSWTIQLQMWLNQVLDFPLMFVYHVPMCLHTFDVSMSIPTWF